MCVCERNHIGRSCGALYILHAHNVQGAKLNKQARSALMRDASSKRVQVGKGGGGRGWFYLENEEIYKKENQIYRIYIHKEFMLIYLSLFYSIDT